MPTPFNRAGWLANRAVLVERLNSAPVTVTSDGQHVGWHVPLKSAIYRTRELAREFCTVEPEVCCTFFARADQLVRVSMTFREYAAAMDPLAATPVRELVS